MRLSAVVELLLILLLVAFAAYGRVIESGSSAVNRSIRASNVPKQSIELPTISQTTEDVNRYCTCSENICNCCRDFHIPLVQLQGPGCASLQYLQDDNLAVQLSFGENILTSTIVNGKSPKPVCVPLPGGFTKFCGRIYSIKRDADNHFKACLGLELQSATELEASLRVSCFRFGPDGLKLRPAEPLPVIETEQASDEDDDDDDIFGLGSDDDDEDTASDTASNTGSTYEATAESEDEDDDDDILGFGALLDIITGEDDSTTKKPKVTTAPPLLQFTIPILTRPTTAATPLEGFQPSTGANDATILQNLSTQDNQDDQGVDNDAQDPNKIGEETNTENVEAVTGFDTNEAVTTISAESLLETHQEETTKLSNKLVKPAKPVTSHKIKRVPAVPSKKPSITSTSINAINDDIKKKKPLKKPIKDEDDDDDILDDDDDDDEDEDDDALDEDKDDDLDDDLDDDDDEDDDDDDIEADTDKHEEDDDDEKAEDLDDLDDDDDEEEDAVLSALVDDDKPKTKKNKAVATPSHHAEEDEDYGIGITDLLARKRRGRGGRQSKVMRL